MTTFRKQIKEFHDYTLYAEDYCDDIGRLNRFHDGNKEFDELVRTIAHSRRVILLHYQQLYDAALQPAWLIRGDQQACKDMYTTLTLLYNRAILPLRDLANHPRQSRMKVAFAEMTDLWYDSRNKIMQVVTGLEQRARNSAPVAPTARSGLITVSAEFMKKMGQLRDENRRLKVLLSSRGTTSSARTWIVCPCGRISSQTFYHRI